jgi:hypothetical protein
MLAHRKLFTFFTVYFAIHTGIAFADEYRKSYFIMCVVLRTHKARRQAQGIYFIGGYILPPSPQYNVFPQWQTS